MVLFCVFTIHWKGVRCSPSCHLSFTPHCNSRWSCTGLGSLVCSFLLLHIAHSWLYWVGGGSMFGFSQEKPGSFSSELGRQRHTPKAEDQPSSKKAEPRSGPGASTIHTTQALYSEPWRAQVALPCRASTTERGNSTILPLVPWSLSLSRLPTPLRGWQR